MTKNRSLLIILPFLPYPLSTGGHHGLFHAIKAISDTFDVSVAYEAYNDEKHKEAIKGFLKAIPNVQLFPLLNEIRKPTLRERVNTIIYSYLQKTKGIFTKKGHGDSIPSNENLCKWWLQTIMPKSPQWLNHINNLCMKNNYDIIQVEMPWMLSQILTLPSNVKKIFIHHELGFVRRELEVEGIEETEYMRACRKFVDQNEIAMLNKYDSIITVSETDAKKLIENGVIVPVYPSFSVVNTTDKTTYYPSNGKQLAFVGPDNHSPNLVGITWFLENCWQRLKEKDQDYKLDIIGKWSQSRIEEIKQKYQDVNFLGFVDDLGTALKGSIMIVPITIGSGIRMKILEASSKGIPFVSTTVGAEGIPVISGKDCFIADTPEEFVKDIQKLQDVELQRQFIINANKMVKENFSIDRLKANRMTLYNMLLR